MKHEASRRLMEWQEVQLIYEKAFSKRRRWIASKTSFAWWPCVRWLLCRSCEAGVIAPRELTQLIRAFELCFRVSRANGRRRVDDAGSGGSGCGVGD